MKRASSKKNYGLIGYPVKHSLSAVMHNAAFKTLGVNAGYRLYEVKPENLKNFVASLKKNKLFGLNVTIPYKQKIIDYLDEVKDTPGLAKKIGAVNTINLEKDKLVGYNTDGQGFIEALNRLEQDFSRRRQFDFKGSSVSLLGAGGAARAVSFNLAKKKVRSLFIYDREHKRTKVLVDSLKVRFASCRIKAAYNIEQLQINKADILINATPIGMRKKDPLLVDSKFLHQDLFVYDLVYNPEGRKVTPLIQEAKNKGLRAHDGLWMLVCQAVESFRIWMGSDFSEEELFYIMAGALKKKGYKLC